MQSVAQAIPAELAIVHGPSDNAAAGLRGWRTAGALDRCTSAWTERLKAFAGELDEHGGKLIAGAGSYRSADTSVLLGINNLGRGGGA